MKLFDVDTIEQAKEKIKKSAEALFTKSEVVPVCEALGRVCAEDVYSRVNVPGFLRSTVDGYAVLAKDTQGAGESIPTFLKIVGEVPMGEAAVGKIVSGQCMYVPTGGMLPEGADAMVMVEFCESFGETDIAVYDAVSVGRNTIEKGEDTKENTVVLKKGTTLRAQDIGALSSVGVTEMRVYTKLRVFVISTGDEITAPGKELTPGKIYDINSYSISSSAIAHGFASAGYAVVKDDEKALYDTVCDAMTRCDIVCMSGGSSQGKKDMTESIINQVSTPGVYTHGLALKPGKPTILGYDEKSETLMCGLPGHPVAAMMVFELLVSDSADEVRGVRKPILIPAAFSTNAACDAGKANCFPVKLVDTEKGLAAQPQLGKSGLITTLTNADGYIVTGENLEGIKENQLVHVRLFK